MLRLRTFGGISLEVDRDFGDWSSRRRRMALLAIVAAAGPRGIGRDRVVAILWPDSSSEQARHALSQTIYALRRDLGGQDVFAAAPELRLDPAAISCDAHEFRAAIRAHRWVDAIALHRGTFLDGFFLSDAPDFERWLDAERSQFAKELGHALENAATANTAAGRVAEALPHWAALAELDPFNGRAAVRYMEALSAAGDRAAALAHARRHTELVRRELETTADPAVAAAAARLRTASAPPPDDHPIPVALATPQPAPPAPMPPLETLVRPRGGGPAIARAVAVVVAALALVLIVRDRRLRTPAPPIVAVGELLDLTAPDSGTGGRVFGDLLTTSLSRLASLEVIATSRMLELLPRGRPGGRSGYLEAARRAGAVEMLEGELSETSDRALRLDLRRIAVATGVVRHGYRVTALDRWALVDSVTSAIALDLELPAGNRGTIPVRSPIALRLYDDGLRALYREDIATATRSFQAALVQDSTFAMAAYHGWRGAVRTGDTAAARLRSLAGRLADRAGPRERLLIRAHLGVLDDDPRSVAAADSLLTGYPRDPEALTRAAGVYAAIGLSIERTVPLLERALAIDSIAGSGASGFCRMCDVFAQLATSYLWADSTEARHRTVARWLGALPYDPAAHAARARLELDRGHDVEAARAIARAGALGSPSFDRLGAALHAAIVRSDPPGIRSACHEALAASASEPDSRRYRRLCAIGLRAMGQLRAAMALATEGRSPFGSAGRSHPAPDRPLTAVIDFAAGRPRIAAAYFAGTAARAAGAGPADAAESFLLAATAAAGAGDTVTARRLADSVAAYGSRSTRLPAPRLHHFVRGLLLAEAGRHADAMVEYRLAISSWPLGLTRINYEMARSAIAMGQHQDAVYPLQAALRGGVDGAQLHVDRTEIHERLAEAFEGLDLADSAAAHFAVVARMWAAADPLFEPRHRAARSRIENRRQPPGTSRPVD